MLAVILGASEWPNSPSLPGSVTFQNSAEAIDRYLRSTEFLNVPRPNILNLFDSAESADEIDTRISNFLNERIKSNAIGLDNIVLIYYTGHGSFIDHSKYCVMLRRSRISNPSTSAYPMGALARTITSCAPNARRLIVIDACFAAAAVPDWLRQSDVASLIQKSTFDALSERGTALLCASSSADVALTPRNGKYTMFSGALIGALEEGDPEFPEKLSPSDIEHIVRTRILEAFQHDGVTPEIHMPDKREGDISKIPIFPNRASRVSYLSDQDLDKVRGLISGYRQQRILSERTIEGLRDYFFEEGEIRRPVADTVEANFLSHALKGAPTLERAILGGDFDRQKVRNEAKQLNFEAASRPTKAKTPEEQQTERQAITEPNSDSGLWKRRAEVFEATVKLGSAESNAKPLLGNEGDREVAGFPINRDDASVILVLLLISPLLMLCVIMGMNERSILADVLVLMTLGACAGGTLFVINLLRRGHNIVLTPWGLLVLDMIVLFTSLVILMFMRPDLLHLA